MEINVVSGDITKHDAGAIIVNLFEGVTEPEGGTGAVDAALDGAITNLIASGDITGKSGEHVLVYSLGRLPSPRVIVSGLGKQDDFDAETVRKVTAEASRKARDAGATHAATIAHGAGIAGMAARESGQAIAEGGALGTWTFTEHKSPDDDRKELESLTIVEFDGSKVDDLQAGVTDGLAIAAAVNRCRTMAYQPPNVMNPSAMVESAVEISHGTGMTLEVLELDECREMGMGAYCGVAKGTDEPPKFIIMRYEGDPENADNNIGLIGKGITFDSGGLSLKPASGMSTMGGDMAGGAAVLCAMEAINHFKPRINVTAVAACTENLPGGHAQRPGDVVKAFNGKTIEVDNTDAEGRLVLADAVAYANSIGIKRMVDVATLTGAIGVALGNDVTGAFGNDQELVDQVVTASRQVGEKIWQLPTYDDYKQQYKSDIADIKNTGGRGAGATIGALIIGEFVGDAAWVHLDIASSANSFGDHGGSDKGYNPKGPNGIPVRGLLQLVRNLAS